MQNTKKTYMSEFKREAVRLAQTSRKPMTHIARELGISDTSIHQWRKEFAEHVSEAFPGNGHQTSLGGEKKHVSFVEKGKGAVRSLKPAPMGTSLLTPMSPPL